MGGLSRQKTVLEDLSAVYGPENTIIINVGDCFADRSTDEVLKDKADFMFDVFDMMGMDVFSIGTRDLIFGLDYLVEKGRKTSYPFLCANMVNKSNSKPYFKPYVVLKKGGKRFLIAQVMDPLSELIDKDTKYKNPVDTLNEIKNSVKHDVFIPIFYTSKDTAKMWLEYIDGVDLAILGSYLSTQSAREFFNNAMLVYNNYNGRSMYYVDIKIDENSKVSINGPFNEQVSEHTVLENKKITKMVEEFKKRNGLDKIKGSTKTVYYQENYYYIGKDWCVKCHEEIVDSWSKSKHAHAMETLIKKGKQDDPECFRCHVTAVVDETKPEFKYTGEFISMAATPHMADVQCESCHGMADVHASEPTDWFGQEVTPEVCMKCHTHERDPDFNYERDLKKTMHVKMIKTVKEK